MNINKKYPKEFSLHLTYKDSVQNSRLQLYNDCWAQSFVSAIGDMYAIQNNLEPVYLSPSYVSSLVNDSCRYLNQKDCTYTLNSGYNSNDIGLYMHENKIGSKLDTCFPYEKTIEYSFEKGYEKYKTTTKNPIKKSEWKEKAPSSYILENINNICPNCINEKIKCSSHITNLDLKKKFQLDIKSIALEPNKQYKIKNKELYTQDIINNIHNTMKFFIMEMKLSIISSIIVTTEYFDFFKDTNNEYFSPQIKLKDNKDKLSHSVVILGWTNYNKKYYWIIRDTNFPNRFLKIEFSQFNNKDYWLSLDIKFDEHTYQSFIVSGNYGKYDLNDYLSKGIFNEVNKFHNEL